jgi:hypothetical protein
MVDTGVRVIWIVFFSLVFAHVVIAGKCFGAFRMFIAD